MKRIVTAGVLAMVLVTTSCAQTTVNKPTPAVAASQGGIVKHGRGHADG
ncbi:MAG TPA: hypothetical protein VN643_28000 [Pyrinomonadaceae bacterium]|nr:hypothetical protein [Pyrinomonadaceae bacterium]